MGRSVNGICHGSVGVASLAMVLDRKREQRVVKDQRDLRDAEVEHSVEMHQRLG